MDKSFRSIFKTGSKTYFYSSLFFPKNIKNDVFTLYAFVRTADDLVDATPQKKTEFEAFVLEYHQALAGKASSNILIASFVELLHKYDLEPSWVEAFLTAMRQDLVKKEYATLSELEAYMYGSAEVIGLMMAQILSLPQESYPAAALQGKAMQYLNFIRDIEEDTFLGRTYLPKSILKEYGLADLSIKTYKKNPQQFEAFIQAELKRYQTWQDQAQAGFEYIPKRYRVPIQTAAEMYGWTARTIACNPKIIFEKKVKPSKAQLITQAVWLLFTA